MPDLKWNKETWDGAHDWTHAGEKWSRAWGNSEAQWFGTLYPRLHRFLPAKRVLEIAPGFGRWTQFLLANCDELVGVDLSAACVEGCQKRFANRPGATFIQNDGMSLEDVGSGFDFIFSFDSLVHAELNVFRSYIPQLVSKLNRGGVAFIHHSNFAGVRPKTNKHSRAITVRAEAVAHLLHEADGVVLHQEAVNWGAEDLIDCFTLFGARSDYAPKPIQIAKNPRFMEEATIVRDGIGPYCAIEPVR